jgi:hypothetical protein
MLTAFRRTELAAYSGSRSLFRSQSAMASWNVPLSPHGDPDLRIAALGGQANVA